MIVCSTSLVFRELQINITMGYHYVKIAKTKPNQQFQMLVMMQRNWNSSSSGMQNGVATLENNLEVFRKLNMYLSCDLPILLLGI